MSTDMEDNRKKNSKKTPKSGKRRAKAREGFLSRNALAVLIAGIAFVIAGIAVASFMLSGYDGDDEPWVYIPEGTSQKAVGDTLVSRLGVGFGRKVYNLWRIQGGDSARAHGAYRVGRSESALRFSRRIAKGMQTPVNVTFNNIRTMPQLAERIASRLEMSAADFSKAMADTLSRRGYAKPEFPAAFLPDTYSFYWTVKSGDLVAKLLAHRDDFWNAERCGKAARLGLTPSQVATVASIVEEETSKTDEMPAIARLYINRVKKGMKLQADPTVKYSIGDFSIRRITLPMLSTVSPYNTYRNAGLPPGPIRIPEASTLDAVLDAPEHNFLFMCAREDFSGYHNFAADYATHQANARRYQAELNRRNIR